MRYIVSEKDENQKESRWKLPKRVLAVALFACLVFVSYRVTGAVVTSATYGDR